MDATFPEVAEPLGGSVCIELAAIARRHRIALVAGVVETLDEPGRAYNTLVTIVDSGRTGLSVNSHMLLAVTVNQDIEQRLSYVYTTFDKQLGNHVAQSYHRKLDSPGVVAPVI